MPHARDYSPAALALIAIVLLLSWSFREEMQGLPPEPVYTTEEDTPVSASWPHTPEGAAGPITITVTRRTGESLEDFQVRVRDALEAFPPDPVEEG